MVKINRQFFIGSFSRLIVILAIWLVVGNLIATLQEKKIDEAKEQFRKQFPKIEANNSALKLEELTAKLGVRVSPVLRTTPTRYFHSSGYEAKSKEFDNIREDLDNYLNTQLEKSTDEIDIPPEELRQYLKSNINLLEAVQNYVINSELPQWEMEDISNYHINDVVPSFLSFINIQKLLNFNILEKTRLGQNREAVKSLKVSWKLQQSIVKRPEFVAQIVAIIIARQQAAVMRKMSNISTDWQLHIEQNIQYKMPHFFLNSLASESFIYSNSARTIPESELKYLLAELLPSPTLIKLPDFKLPDSLNDLKYLFYFEENSNNSIDLAVLNPLYRPYLRLAGINYWDKINRTARELPKKYHCSFESDLYIGTWKKVIKMALQMELTQKILQIKEIANEQGKWPKKVPGIESSAICKDAKWIYQVSDKSTMSISLGKRFDFLNKTPNEKGYIPFKYSAKYKRNLNFKEGL